MGQVLTREHSSVGLEHLPYKQRVGGSTPSAPTKGHEFRDLFSYKGVMKQWHAIRVTYSRELKFQSILEEAGYETFIPMVEKKFDVSGKKFTKVVPAISNLCFVRAVQQELYEFFKSLGEACPARFIWDKSTREPIIVNEKAMQDFIKVSKAMLDDTVYLNDISSKLREGQMVRITAGAFAGVEGRIVRIRKSRRIMVELQGMLAVAATYIPTDGLELL